MIGDVRPQDVFEGMSSVSLSSLHPVAGIENDFDLMQLMATSLTSGQTPADDAILRSGSEDAAVATFGHAKPFDHAIDLVDRSEMAGVSVQHVTTDYVLG